jgi:hypothetical protein
MEILRLDTGAAFLHEAESFLVTQEAANCLVLGISLQFALYPGLAASAAFLAVVKDKGEVLAAAVRTPPGRLVVAVTESRAALAVLAERIASTARDTPGVHGARLVSQMFAEE